MRTCFTRLSLATLVLVSLASFAPRVHAQTAIKPHLLFLIDTSGSMRCGTGSTGFNSCGVNGSPGAWDSFCGAGSERTGRTRLTDLRCAMTNVVTNVSDAVIGLARFRITSCLANSCSGTSSPLTPDPFCTATDSMQLLFPLIDTGINPAMYPTDRATIIQRELGFFDFTPPGGACIVGNTTALACSSSGSPDINADGSTPLGGVLDGARIYFQSGLTSPATGTNNRIFDVSRTIPSPIVSDPLAACRPRAVILMTDGGETCGGNGPARAADLLNLQVGGQPRPVRTYVIGFGTAVPFTILENIATSGGTDARGANRAYYANNEAEIAIAINDIISDSQLREFCNGVDDNCNSVIDEGYNVGSACTVGVGVCARTGALQCVAGATSTTTQCSVTAGAPGAENTQATCSDNLDNDCDGRTDCADPDCAATPRCAGSCVPQPETCNGRDDDCDGAVDEGNPGGGTTCGLTLGVCRAGTTACQAGGIVCVGQVAGSAELCDGLDNDCNGAVDEGITQACGSMVGECRQGVQRCVGGTFAGQPCLGSVGPRTETCNGLDDDCNGSVDNGNPGGGSSCGTDTGACTRGTIQCMSGALMCVGGSSGSMETCNGVDDDCNGVVDDNVSGTGAACDGGITFPGGMPQGICQRGVTACRGGPGLVCLGAIGPMATETCNGLDDNCNGMVDEGNPGGGVVCGTAMGTCQPGMTACTGGRVVCMGGTQPTDEVCNGIDDNCNGFIDEGLPVGAACGSSLGICQPGVFICRAGMLVCEGGTPPATEICNGLDDDCNGMIDEGLPEGQECGSMMGLCMTGRLRCIGGMEICEGSVPAMPEQCDCLDNDCDGMTDEPPATGTLCPGGSECISCQCALECEPSEFGPRCPSGKAAEMQADGRCFCVGERCNATDCATQTIDTPSGGCAPGSSDVGACVCRNNACTFACDGVTCSPGTTCGPRSNGRCVEDNCRGLGCAAGQICDVMTGACEADRCATVMCASGEVCRDGTCERSCAGVMCPAGQTCTRGMCAGNMCSGVSCAGGQVCDPASGMCVMNRCTTVRCNAGFVCAPLTGTCIPDPCNGLTCPAGQRCVAGECTLTTGPDAGVVSDMGPSRLDLGPADSRTRLLASGSGCYCSVPAAPGGSMPRGALALVLLAGLAMLLRKRRRAVGPALALAMGGGAALGGCNVEPYCVDCVDDASVDARTDSGARPDAGRLDGSRPDGTTSLPDAGPPDLGPLPDAGPCIGVDFQTDVRNCGACGRACAPARAFGQCVAGACRVMSCDVGFYDLDGAPDNGCEYRCLPTTSNDVLCDRRDNDCDGMVDEDVDTQNDRDNCGNCGRSCRFPGAMGGCTAGVCTLGACQTGFYDINGTLADGCEYACTPASPAVEQCNGLDDNCDGMVDEGDPGGGAACGSAVGQCRRGVNRCTMGRIVCTGATDPVPEQCNGLDDDCNNMVDDGSLVADARIGAFCGNGVGECRRGQNVCSMGSVACMGGTGPATETCNGRDDDCDGMVDDGVPSGGPCGMTRGVCVAGTLQCMGGGQQCVGDIGPKIELCNSLDDDCDGVTDNGFDLQNDASNCGMCGRTCSSLMNAFTGCSTGNCALLACRPGFVDRDGNAMNGCEYACTFRGPTETCNGLDDNCNGTVDEGVTAPAGFCRTGGACGGSAITPSCMGTMGWRCAYPAGVDVDAATGQPAAAERRCDAVDNNCNGAVDEAFTNLGAFCSAGQAGTACFNPGMFVCRPDQTGTQCSVTAGLPPGTEVCNNRDDDCDGSIDETSTAPGTSPSFVSTAWTRVTPTTSCGVIPGSNGARGRCTGNANCDGTGNACNAGFWCDATTANPNTRNGATCRAAFWMMQYEASAPNATDTTRGDTLRSTTPRTVSRACSTANRRPWTSVTIADATAACTAAGGRLCTEGEWQASCEVRTTAVATNCAYSYAASCTTYAGTTCNGLDFDAATDALLPTGGATTPMCRAVWSGGSVYDLSGNAREFTAARSTDTYPIRGGGYNSPGGATRCDANWTVADGTFFFDNVGFRCCSDAATAP